MAEELSKKGNDNLVNILKWVTPVIAVITLIVAWLNLDAIEKTSELAASQAVIDTYYKARNDLLNNAAQDNAQIVQALLTVQEIEKTESEGSEVRQMVLNSLAENVIFREQLKTQIIEDYVNIVHHMCRQSELGILGTSAKSFLKEVVIQEVREVEKGQEVHEIPEKDRIAIDLSGCER